MAREVEEAMSDKPRKVDFTAHEWSMIREAVSAHKFANEEAADDLHAKLRGLNNVGKFHAVIRTK